MSLLSLCDDELLIMLDNFRDCDIVSLICVSKRLSLLAASVLQKKHGFEAMQLAAFVSVVRGMNTFITGGGGTGKSYVTRLLVKAMQELHGVDAVGVTATTGIAACNVGGSTIDRFLGFRKVHVTEFPTRVFSQAEANCKGAVDDDACGFLNNGECFVPVENEHTALALGGLKVLFVDEVSMLSDGKLQLMLRALERYMCKLPQLVFIGDFFQLSPVFSKGSVEQIALSKNRVKRLCFEGASWAAQQFQCVELDISKRCVHAKWNSILNRIRKGESMNMQLKNQIERCVGSCSVGSQEAASIGTLGIYGTNKLCDWHNKVAYAKLPGEESRFVSVDSPTSWGSLPVRFARELRIKAGMKVLLLENRVVGNQLLPNGASATVCATPSGDVDCNEAGILLHFVEPDCGTVRIGTSEDTCIYKRNRTIETGSRLQFPLKHAAAFTVHKSQGRSIPYRQFIDMSSIWGDAGMVYVALSRTTDPKLLDLQYLVRAKITASQSVRSFYKRINLQALPFFCKN